MKDEAEKQITITDHLKDVVQCDPTASVCVTCSDEALPAAIIRVDHDAGLALVAIGETTTEVDVSLVDAVTVGDQVLIHGGVALGKL